MRAPASYNSDAQRMVCAIVRLRRSHGKSGHEGYSQAIHFNEHPNDQLVFCSQSLAQSGQHLAVDEILSDVRRLHEPRALRGVELCRALQEDALRTTDAA